ncbi:hypothetical protein Scep_026654 [Stephania cephalantha]|uniref:Uncharacterized protein n=1 Tax=Stephania cephalantha TaxID=152367 RepID=A0AAP0EKJ2_9MAGN
MRICFFPFIPLHGERKLSIKLKLHIIKIQFVNVNQATKDVTLKEDQSVHLKSDSKTQHHITIIY